MKKLVLAAAAFVCVMGFGHMHAANARVAVYANFGCCGYGYGPYPAYPAYYSPYYYPYYGYGPWGYPGPYFYGGLGFYGPGFYGRWRR